MGLIDSAVDALFRPMTCPFCSEEFYLGDCAIVSGNTGTVLHPAPTKRLTRLSSRMFVRPLVGRKYTREMASRQCPHCGKALPFNTPHVDENITIAVIGDIFSGKSHFIAALIQQLKERKVPPAYGFIGFNAASQDVEDRYRHDYYDPLFGLRNPLPGNIPATNPLTEPLIYEMTIGSSGKRINLLLYDASGEELANQQRFVRYKPHILNAKAIIFLADPWAMPGFVDRLAHHLRPDPAARTGRTASEVLNLVMDTFKRDSNQVGGAKFSIPVAIALSKSDLIPYLMGIDPGYQWLSDPMYPSFLNSNESQTVNRVVRTLLEDIEERSLLGLEETTEKVNFFAISATGSGLDAQNKYTKVEPHRCLEPLFWILRELPDPIIDDGN